MLISVGFIAACAQRLALETVSRLVERGGARPGYGLGVILVVAATEAELRGAGGAATLVCGVGPVEAAARTAAALAGGRPHAALHVGVAGAHAFDGPAFVVGSRAVYCDADDPRWIALEAPADDRLVAAARRALPDARVEPIGTSARVGGSSGCDVEAMEGYAVLRACALAGVPAVEVRVLANRIAEPDRGLWRLDDARDALATALPTLVAGIEEAVAAHA
jgi:futalosine hydrolase